MTQKELSERAGISQSMISKLEKIKNPTSTTLDTLESIAETLGVCPSSMIFNDCINCTINKKDRLKCMVDLRDRLKAHIERLDYLIKIEDSSVSL